MTLSELRKIAENGTCGLYLVTFNPQTVLAMIEEIELVRAFDNMNNIEDVDLELKKIDNARAKLDAILKGCEG